MGYAWKEEMRTHGKQRKAQQKAKTLTRDTTKKEGTATFNDEKAKDSSGKATDSTEMQIRTRSGGQTATEHIDNTKCTRRQRTAKRKDKQAITKAKKTTSKDDKDIC